MSSGDFVKGVCRQCGGHLEFPAASAGTSITCPHCGWTTELEARAVPERSPKNPENPRESPGLARRLPGIGIGVLVIGAALAGGYFYWNQASRSGGLTAGPPPVAPSNSPIVSHPAPVAPPKPQPQEITNDFAVMPFKLEKTAGSSLVYVTGMLENRSDQQRFGVKIEFSLFDTNDNRVGAATDYQGLLEPHGEWRFKALVMASKAVSARFESSEEQK
jgi:hypothetical protein